MRFRSSDQAEFHQRIERHIGGSPKYPLLMEGAAGLGKTLPYSLAVVSAVNGGMKGAVVLPTRSLINQYMASRDLEAALKAHPGTSVRVLYPKKAFDGDIRAYRAHLEEARAADILVCTSAAVLFDQWGDGEYCGVIDREILIFDEADQLPSAAALQVDVDIPKAVLSDYKVSERDPLRAARALARKTRGVDPEVYGQAYVLMGALDESKTYRNAGFGEDGGLVLWTPLPGRVLKHIANRAGSIFISATLSVGGQFRYFQGEMGIDEISHLSTRIEPEHHGKVFWDFQLDDEVGTDEWLHAVALIAEYAEGPMLVATSSHALSRDLGKLVPRAFVRDPDETVRDAAMRIAPSGILIAAGAWSGLDVPFQWRTVLVPRVPFGRPDTCYDTDETDPDRQLLASSHYLSSRVCAERRMIQVFARGLRKPDAVCRIVICDPRVSQLQDIPPQRFKAGYYEGLRLSHTLTASERSPKVRLEALRHYGSSCFTCNWTPRHLRQVEVHHLVPLADRGPGFTRMEDVRILCRNCHGLAHSVSGEVMPLEEIRSQMASP